MTYFFLCSRALYMSSTSQSFMSARKCRALTAQTVDGLAQVKARMQTTSANAGLDILSTCS